MHHLSKKLSHIVSLSLLGVALVAGIIFVQTNSSKIESLLTSNDSQSLAQAYSATSSITPTVPVGVVAVYVSGVVGVAVVDALSSVSAEPAGIVEAVEYTVV